MGSRIRENVKHLFQCFCEVVGPQTGGKEAWIIQKFPDSYRDEEVLKSVPKFAYPCDFPNTIVQHYSFVLTSIDSKWTFGFCRHDPKTETALLVLSFLPWHESFYKLLNHIAEINASSKSDELWRFLDAVYQSKVPEPGNTLRVPFNDGEDTFVCPCPNQFQLPSIPENRNLTEYYNAVDAHNMMIIFASMLYERRIIFISKKLYRLSACVQSANAIIYPMNWQHIFIPVLPMALMDYLLAPMPYLIGVPEPIYHRVRKTDLGEVVVLDADNNKVETPFADLESLPADVVNSLRRQLRNRAALLGDGVSRAFLRALVQLIGGYRDALKFHQGQKITFSAEAFIESRPTSMQPFLRKMLQLQIFQQFIEERLEMLNNGLGFSDEFEMEACNYSDKSSSKLKQQYKEWTYTMKKEGSAFFKTVKSKANPAMKSAVKSVKERGKDVRTAYKGIRSKLRDLQPREGLGSREDGLDETEKDEKPHSAPTSPVNKRRPHTFGGPKATAAISFRKETLRQRKSASGSNRSKPYSALSPSSDPGSPEAMVDRSQSETPGLQLSPLDMDLMGDLQDVIFQKCSSFLDTEESVSPPVDRSHQESTDLIRLDSTPSEEDFDPLSAKDKATKQTFSQTTCNEGLSNPLYPYFIPNIGKTTSSAASSSTIGNQSFLYSQSQRNAAARLESGSLLEPKPFAQMSNVHQSGGQNYSARLPSPTVSSAPNLYSSQDMDLLKEYGLDFKTLSLHNGTTSQSTMLHTSSPATSKSSSGLVDPFDDLVSFSDSSSQVNSQKQWTTFD